MELPKHLGWEFGVARYSRNEDMLLWHAQQLFPCQPKVGSLTAQNRGELLEIRGTSFGAFVSVDVCTGM